MNSGQAQEATQPNKPPFNINISFNINPKNILNSVMPIQSQSKGKKMNEQEKIPPNKSIPLRGKPPRTPQLIQTDRLIQNKQIQYIKSVEGPKKRKQMKRNSMDNNFNQDTSLKLEDFDKSVKMGKKNETCNVHARKKSAKSKNSEVIKSKRTKSKLSGECSKSGGRLSGIENNILKSGNLDSNVTDRKIIPKNFFKPFISKTISNEYRKVYSTASKTKQILETRRKTRRKSKVIQSDAIISKELEVDEAEIGRKKLIEKLTSLRSMNNSLFHTEVDEQYPLKKQKSIVINTEESMECIDEIHQYEVQKLYSELDEKVEQVEKNQTTETQKLISTYIAIMQEEISYEGNEVPLDQSNSFSQNSIKKPSKRESLFSDLENSDQIMRIMMESKGEKMGELIKPFSSDEINKEQNLLNTLERIKLNELKKHQIEKWEQILVYIKKSLNQGTTDTQQLLKNIYDFLSKTKNDLQTEVIVKKTITKDDIDELNKKIFKNKKNQEEKQEEIISVQEVSQLSFQSENEEDDQLKLLNLQTIESALKQRYENLIDRKEKQIQALEFQRDQGRITEEVFRIEKEKVEKWISSETNEITKAKRSIWKGYNEAKSVLEKTAKTKYFEENDPSGKKKNMMKCLSENYLLKANYKNLLFQKQSSPSVQSEEKKNQENSDEQELEKIKEKLLDIKNQHRNLNEKKQEFPQEESPNISYEEVQKQLEQSYQEEEENLIKNQFTQKPTFLQIENEKLKYMCAQDKQDIFEFIFLDLCIQLYQEPCHENAIMESISEYINKMRRQASKKKGVRTSLNIVKDYLKKFIAYIFKNHQPILRTIDDPLGPTAMQMLRYMHDNDEENNEQQEVQTTLVIPIKVFDQYEKIFLPSIEFEKYYEFDEEKERRRVEFLKNILHIHNKAVFDSLNEFLDQLRPYGIWGKPFPWKKSSTFLHVTDQSQKQDKLKKANDKVVQYCSYVCGLLVDKQESLIGNARLSEQYIEQIKEDRLSRMLANQLVENEERWLFYDDEETEVLVEVGHYIYNMLIKEAAYELSVDF